MPTSHDGLTINGFIEVVCNKYGKMGNKFKKIEWEEVQSTSKIMPEGSKYYVMTQQISSHTADSHRFHRGMTRVITSFPSVKRSTLKMSLTVNY